MARVTMEDAPKPALRERKQARIRATLIAEAMRLFSAQGYDATTVDEIAEAAEISRRTLFRRFATKGDIVLAWTQDLTAQLTEALAECPVAMHPSDAMQHAFIAVLPLIASNRRDMYALICLIEKTPALRSVSAQKYERWEECLAADIARRLSGHEDRKAAARLMARTGIVVLRAALDEWIRLKGRPALVPILRRMFALQGALWAVP